MGWTFSSSWPSKKAVHVELFTQLGGADRVIDQAATSGGAHYWALVRGTDGQTAVFLGLVGAQRGYGYGYKDMDETCGPCEVDCPLRLIDAADAPLNEWAREWREKVRAYHVTASKKRAQTATNRKSLRVGSKIVLHERFTPRGPLVVTNVNPLRASHEFAVYRVRFSQVAEVIS